MQIGNFDTKICQLVASRMYTYRPWSWSLKFGAPNSIPLLPGIQDYPAPDDIYDLVAAWFTITSPQPNGQPYDPFNPNLGGSPSQNWQLEVVDFLSPDLNPNGFLFGGAITLISNPNVFRLNRAVQPPTPQNPAFLNFQYQPKMEKITDTSMAVPFPDEYADVAAQGLLYWLYKFGDDDRAGTTVRQGNNVEYTGQLGEFEASLFRTAALDQTSEVSTFFPESSLGHNWFWGPYPFIWIN